MQNHNVKDYQEKLQQAQKILVVRRDNIGDLLCTTPLIHALKKSRPDVFLGVLVTTYNAPVIENNPDIDCIHAYTKAKHSLDIKLVSWWREWQVYRQIRQKQYDLVIHANPVPHDRTARLLHRLKIPWRLGVVSGADGEHYNLPLTPDDISGTHHVQQVFSLLSALGIQGDPGPLVLPSPEKPDATRPRVGIQLSTRKSCNRWPTENYRQIIRRLSGMPVDIVLLWSPGARNDPLHPGDDELAALVKAEFPNVLAEKTHRLQDLIELINSLDLMLCPDGGAIHIAAALQIPVVGLYGCVDSALWGPWGNPAIVFEGKQSADEIAVDDVFHALEKWL